MASMTVTWTDNATSHDIHNEVPNSHQTRQISVPRRLPRASMLTGSEGSTPARSWHNITNPDTYEVQS
jgi:hypothetical protein